MSKSDKLPIKIVICVTLFILVMLVVYYWRSFNSEANEIADIVNRGNALMAAECYKEAIECYELALQKEPENEKTVLAIINAYMLIGKSKGDSDDAVLAYLTAIAIRPNNRSAYWALADIYENRGDEDSMMETLQRGFEDTGDTTMQKKITRIMNEHTIKISQEEQRIAEEARRQAKDSRASSMLGPLFELFENEDYDTIYSTLNEQRYIDFSDELVGKNFYYYGEFDSDGLYNGKGLAAYPNGFYYFGEFWKDVRCGHGIWYKANYPDTSTEKTYLFEGEWANDAPNGKGVSTLTYKADKIDKNDFITEVIEGEYRNGRENGHMSFKGTKKDKETRDFAYDANEGIAKQIVGAKSLNDGVYVIAETKNKSAALTSDGSVRCVEGFEPPAKSNNQMNEAQEENQYNSRDDYRVDVTRDENSGNDTNNNLSIEDSNEENEHVLSEDNDEGEPVNNDERTGEANNSLQIIDTN